MSPSQDDRDVLQRFETIWEHVECGICIIDAESREILDLNPVAVRMFGGDKELMIGKRCHKFICPAETSSCPIMDLGQTVDRSERKFIRTDGLVVPIIKSVAKITYNGRQALLESFTDISKLKSAEEELARAGKQAQARLKSILNSMDALISVCSVEDHHILFLNDRIRENFGIEGDGVGEVCYQLLQGRDEPCEACPYLRIMEEPGRVIIWEHNESVKGAVLHKAARLIDWPGVGKAHLEYAIDITELRQAQEALERRERMLAAQAHWYKSIFDATPIPISVTDAGMNWTLVNKAAETMLGIRYEDLIGRPCSEWNTPICGTVKCGIACVKRGETRTFFQQAGSSYQIDIGTLSDLDGQLTGFIEVIQDITEVANLARKQGEMEKNISQLEQEVDKIFYDPLTGIYSRRFFDENIDRLLGSLARSRGVLSLMMADIDYFKQYNDTYGHLKGDDCLRIVAETLRNCLARKDDFVARYGGEEFVIILPNTDESGARLLAERMLEEVRKRRIPHARSDAADCVTVSIGLVAGLVKPAHRRDDFLKRADEMLYESKQGGRNRYAFAALPEG